MRSLSDPDWSATERLSKVVTFNEFTDAREGLAADDVQSQSAGQTEHGAEPAELMKEPSAAAGFDFAPFDQFGQFAYTLDGLGLPDEWSLSPQPFQHSRPSHRLTASSHRLTSEGVSVVATPGSDPDMERPPRSETPFISWLPSAPTQDQIPVRQSNRKPSTQADGPAELSGDARDKLLHQLQAFSDVLDSSFVLPSRHTLSRYLAVYLMGYNQNLPFIHHTWRATDGPVELTLVICAIGAQNCCEHSMAAKLFCAAHTIQMVRLRREAHRIGRNTMAALPGLNLIKAERQSAGLTDRCGAPAGESWQPIDAVRAFLLLLCYVTWCNDANHLEQTLVLWTFLGQITADIACTSEAELPRETSGEETWRDAMHAESCTRALLSANSFLTTVSIAYDFGPSLHRNESGLRLPCSQEEWDAPDQGRWEAAKRALRAPQLMFGKALSSLLAHDSAVSALDPLPTSFGNYLLLHGLLRRILLVRALNHTLEAPTTSIAAMDIEKLERALRAWTTIWQATPESSVDPNTDRGRIPSTSSALLSLAYVRLHLNTGPCRDLQSRDPRRMAEALQDCPPVSRSEAVVSALLYATHALSIPVRLGLDRVARAQAHLWTIRHSLAAFESAIMLSKWLSAVAETIDQQPLTDAEAKIVYWVRCIIEEASAVLDGLNTRETTSSLDVKRLRHAVLDIWAYFFRRHTLHATINTMGECLWTYRHLET